MSEAPLWQMVEGMGMAYKNSAVLLTAVEIGLFEALYDAPLTGREAAERLKVSPRRLTPLLDLLAFHRMLDRTGDRYGIAPEWRPLIDPSREDNLTARYGHNARLMRAWAFLPRVLTEDRNAADLPEMVASHRDPASFHRSLGSRGLAAMRGLLPQVPLPSSARLLDIGGGFGDLGRPFLERDEGAKLWLFEVPGTARLAVEHWKRLGMADRFTAMGGDFLTDPWPEGMDLVLISNILHIFSEETIRALLARARASLAPGGGVLIREFIVADDRSGPLKGLEFALNMAINTETGDVYSESRVRSWLAGAGFSRVRTLRGGEPDHYTLWAEI